MIYPYITLLFWGKPSSLELIILFVLIGLFVDSFSHKKSRFFLIGFIFLFFFITKNPMRASITAVDIGQGDSIFLQDKFNKENILIDTGGQLALPQKNWQKTQTQSNADKTLIPYLESMGVAHIDQLILTHTDADHVGDFLSLADKIKIREIWVSPGELTNSSFVEKLKKAKIPIHVSKVGDKIPIFDSFLQVLSNGYTKKGDNNDSIVTYGNFYHTKFLFTGDLEQEGEKKLLQNYPKLQVDVLKVGHHGSKTSSSPEFIKEIHPKLALISVGKANRYGHPNQETLETLAKYQVKTLRTDQKGAIKLTEVNQQWQIKTVR
ncbi:DNA internalization-related competence protein ComEC/Rec2 [Lactococcus cremoris]|nr:DNA internalization-related competence protein ComEC/Rec2 [Lactococcus cremoris]